MRTFKLIGLLCIIGILGCEDLNLYEDVPKCIEKQIKEFRDAGATCDSGARVYRYDFQSMEVYLFDPGTCGADMEAPIYDEECNVLCALGGITGNIMCNDLVFADYATNETLIWKN